tara:strand:- start:20626 stop:21762 length:1137 start_codon:yes stop_codon:yes gene_type:complete
MCFNDHRPYISLEQFRQKLIAQYLDIYNDILVLEKIHGSNICICGKFSDGEWTFKYGSRKRWVGIDENFNNLQKLFEKHKQCFIDLFNSITSDGCREGAVIRVYGEIFGGKYGHESTPKSFKTQREPNYGPDNDFAFFGIIVNAKFMPIIDAVDAITNSGLKVPPIIFRGKFSEFAKTFDVNKFQSRVSKEYYGLDYIDVPKGTEGVVFFSTNPDATGDELTVMKWKQTWAVENPRVAKKNPIPVDSGDELTESCVAMINLNRIISYASKNTDDDITNPRLIGSHVKAIVEDTMKDVREEFPTADYPNLNIRLVNKRISQKAFPMFKQYLKDMEVSSMPNDKRIELLNSSCNSLMAEANMLQQRLNNALHRLDVISSH